jgi:DNA-binding IclR family transcriptional regulator
MSLGKDLPAESKEKNVVPVIERMLDMLDTIEKRPDGATIRDLCDFLDMPRSTVYRILNTLEVRDVVRRTLSGSYVLGPRLLSLASHVVSSHDAKLAGIAQPHLERLSKVTGEASKLSVIDGDAVLVLYVAHGTGEYGLNVKLGRRLPLHAGAASKVLLAFSPPERIAQVLGGTLPRYTTGTLANPDALRAELELIRQQGWALDRGEYSDGVCAVAAPIRDRTTATVAAVSMPFMGGRSEARIAELRKAVSACAEAVTADLMTYR